MRVWITILLFVLGITAFLLLVSFFASFMIAHAANRHSGKTITKEIGAIEKLLPGKNCGKCGCATCAEYAHAVFSCRMDTDCCTEGTQVLSRQLEEQLAKFQKLIEEDV